VIACLRAYHFHPSFWMSSPELTEVRIEKWSLVVLLNLKDWAEKGLLSHLVYSRQRSFFHPALQLNFCMYLSTNVVLWKQPWEWFEIISKQFRNLLEVSESFVNWSSVISVRLAHILECLKRTRQCFRVTRYEFEATYNFLELMLLDNSKMASIRSLYVVRFHLILFGTWKLTSKVVLKVLVYGASFS